MSIEQSLHEGRLPTRRDARWAPPTEGELLPDELAHFAEKRMVAQVILAARYAEKRMPKTLSGDAFREAQERYSLEWMEDAHGRSFSRGVRKMTDRAVGEEMSGISSEEWADALRFTHALLELGSAQKPQEDVSGVSLRLTAHEEALADELQAMLDRIEPTRTVDELM